MTWPSRTHRGRFNIITGVDMEAPSAPEKFRKSFTFSRDRWAPTVELWVYPTVCDGIYIAAAAYPNHGIRLGSPIVREGEVWKVYQDIDAAERGMLYTDTYYTIKLDDAYLSFDSLGVALTLAWDLDLRAGHAERLAEYEGALKNAHELLRKYRDERLQDAADRSDWAKEVNDILDRWNPMSRAAIICSAIRRIEGWIPIGEFHRDGVDARRLALLVVRDHAWGVRNEVLTDLVEIHGHWWHPDRIERLDRKQASKLARRLKENYKKLEGVVVAPFGTRSFPRAIEDLKKATHLLGGTSTKNWDTTRGSAGEFLDRTRRALELLEAHRHLAQIRATVGVRVRFNLPFSDDDVLLLRASFASVLAILGATSDEDFRTPIVRDVQGRVRELISAIESPSGFQLNRLYEHLELACRPF